MAKTVNNVKINSAFTTAASREQLTSGENLCTSLGKINKYLADLDSGAFTFPANGGNADTLDGNHAYDFALKTEIPTSLPANGGMSDTADISYHQHLRILSDGEDILEFAISDECIAGDNIRVKDSPSCPINFGYDASDNDFFYQVFKLDNLWITVKASDSRSNAEFVNSYYGGNWLGWARCSDGGNAASVNGLSIEITDVDPGEGVAMATGKIMMVVEP